MTKTRSLQEQRDITAACSFRRWCQARGINPAATDESILRALRLVRPVESAKRPR